MSLALAGHFGTPRADWPVLGSSSYYAGSTSRRASCSSQRATCKCRLPSCQRYPAGRARCLRVQVASKAVSGTLAAVPVRKVQVELNLSKLAPDLNLSFFRLSASALGHCTAFILEGIHWHWQVSFGSSGSAHMARACTCQCHVATVTHPPPEQGPSPFSLGEDHLQVSELDLHLNFMFRVDS